MNPGFLFIAGCERSGTTAMERLLNGDDRIIVTHERFKFIRREVTPAHFALDRFFNPIPEETNDLNPEVYEQLRQRWDSGPIAYLGDKVPLYYQVMPHLAEAFPGCRIIYILRDLNPVASSYNVRASNPDDANWPEHRDYRDAVANWNESLKRLWNFVERFGTEHLFVVKYERFFAGDAACLEALYRFLELPLTAEVRRRFRAATADWPERSGRALQLSDGMKDYLAKKKNGTLEAAALSLAEQCVAPQAAETVRNCGICGGSEFEEGPGGRHSATGLPARCAHCGSLERDRVVYAAWGAIPEARRRAMSVLSLNRHPGLREDQFANFQVLPLDPGDQAAIQQILAELPANSFDAIGCNYLLQRIENDRAAVQAMLRALKPGGFIQVTVPNPVKVLATKELAAKPGQPGSRYRVYGADFGERFDDVYTVCALEHDPVTGTPEMVYFLTESDETRKMLGGL
ncbi:MAG: methyltransferase domain-containing protein [Nitrospiraceae bacterium]|nr:methyltransferase domain-containing protein [Nitrospiraceae bacterium]